MATGLYARLTSALQQEARKDILQVAQRLLPISPEYRAAVRQRLTAWFVTALRQERLTLETSIARREKQLARADLGVLPRKYLKHHLGKLPPLTPGVGHDFEVKDGLPLARLLRLTLTPASLTLCIAGLALGAVLVGTLDFLMVKHLIREGSLTIIGLDISPPFERVAVSLATIMAYTLMGILWGTHWTRRGAVGVLYVILFGYLASFTSAKLDEDITGFWAVLVQWLWVGIKTAVYTIPGILLGIAEHWLWFWLRLSQAYAMTGRMVAEDDHLQREHSELAEVASLERDTERVAVWIENAEDHACQEAAAFYAQHADAVNTRRDDLTTCETDKEEADAQRVQVNNRLHDLHDLRTAGMLTMLLGCGLWLAGCSSEPMPVSEQDYLATISNFVAVVDQSASSPALNPSWLQATFTQNVDPAVHALGLGATIVVMGIGDHSQPLPKGETRVQARQSPNGLPPKKITPWVHDRLLALSKPAHPVTKSELVAGICEAGKALHAHAPQSTLLFYSDGIEQSPYVNCGRSAQDTIVGKDKKPPKVEASKGFCKLPPPPCQLPGNAKVTMIGIGVGLDGRQGAVLQEEWRQFFVKAGVKPDKIVFKH